MYEFTNDNIHMEAPWTSSQLLLSSIEYEETGEGIKQYTKVTQL